MNTVTNSLTSYIPPGQLWSWLPLSWWLPLRIIFQIQFEKPITNTRNKTDRRYPIHDEYNLAQFKIDELTIKQMSVLEPLKQNIIRVLVVQSWFIFPASILILGTVLPRRSLCCGESLKPLLSISACSDPYWLSCNFMSVCPFIMQV